MLKAMPFDEAKRKAALGIERFINDEHGLDVLKRLYYGPTVTICGMQAGYTGEGMKTVLPNTAFAKIDCRLVPDLTPEICVALLRAHLDRRGFGDVEIVPLNGEHPATSPVDAPIVAACQAAVRDVYGHDAGDDSAQRRQRTDVSAHDRARHPHSDGGRHVSRLARSRAR